MKTTILGVQHKAGKFTDEKTGKPVVYDNIMLHGVCRNMEVTGEAVKVFKVKSENMGEIIAQAGGSYKDLVGKLLDIELGAYDKVQYIELVG